MPQNRFTHVEKTNCYCDITCQWYHEDNTCCNILDAFQSFPLKMLYRRAGRTRLKKFCHSTVHVNMIN